MRFPICRVNIDMIPRRLQAQLLDLLGQYPTVALLGARQVGKTTLARTILAGRE